MKLYTIGHSNHSLDFFLSLLEKFSIEAVVDVRSYPYSKFVPHFNRESLKEALQARGIEYIWMGDKLGGKFTLGKHKELRLPSGKIDWEKVKKADFFLRGIEELCRLAQEKTVAIMCAEENPARCHRGFLITPVLLEKGVEVFHIRKNGRAVPAQSSLFS